ARRQLGALGKNAARVHVHVRAVGMIGRGSDEQHLGLGHLLAPRPGGRNKDRPNADNPCVFHNDQSSSRRAPWSVARGVRLLAPPWLRHNVEWQSAMAADHSAAPFTWPRQ